MNKAKNNTIDLFFKKINCQNNSLYSKVVQAVNYLPPILKTKDFDLNLTEWLFLNREDAFTYLGFLRAAIDCKEQGAISAERAKQLTTFFDWYVSKKAQDYLDAGVSQSTAFYNTCNEYAFNEDFGIQHGISLLIRPIFDAIADLLHKEHSTLLNAILMSVFNVHSIEKLAFNFFLNQHAYELLVNHKFKFNNKISLVMTELITRSKYTLFIPSTYKEALLFCQVSVPETYIVKIANLAGTFYRYNTNDLVMALNTPAIKLSTRFDLFTAFALSCVHQESIPDLFKVLEDKSPETIKQNLQILKFTQSLQSPRVIELFERLELYQKMKDF